MHLTADDAPPGQFHDGNGRPAGRASRGVRASDGVRTSPCWPGAAPRSPHARLIGRATELAALREATAPGDGRFVTLTGIGGVGKSRLAAELGLTDLDRRDGRVAVVELDAVQDAALVLPAIAGALGVAKEAGRPLADSLAEALGRAPSLLVLDTLDHLRAAAPDLAELLARTRGLTILATSRVPLGVPRERVIQVEPLAVPPPGDADAAALDAWPATALFLGRALEARPEFIATPANAELVAEICRRLDGIPLAIELAAAALRVLPPHQLLDQLADRVTATPADAPVPERQRSLRAAMDWSIGLLSEPVTRLYRRLGVIAGPFRAPTAAAILERGEERGLAPLEVDLEDGLRQLVAASLLRVEAGAVPPAYTMLRTVRGDALDRLARSGEAIAMRWAHAYEVLALVEEAERDIPTERELDALDRLESGHDDIREAIEWALEAGDGAFSVRLTGGLAEFWRTHGHHTEGRLRLAAALAIAPDAPASWRRKALAGAGLLASNQGDYRLGEAYLREALAVARAEGDDDGAAVVLNWLGTNAYGAGNLDAAERCATESLALRRRIGDEAGIAAALNALGGVYHFRGDLDRARETFLESLEIKQGLGNQSSIAVALSNLGLLERDAGRPERAADAFRQAIQIWERSGDLQRVAVAVHNTALVAMDTGRLDEAAAALDRAFELAHDLGDRVSMAYTMADRIRVEVERGDLDAAARALSDALPRAHALNARVILPLAVEGAAALAAAHGDDELAVRLWAAAATERASSGYANPPVDERMVDAKIAAVRDRLDPATFATAWATGSAMRLSDAIEAAMTLAGWPVAGPTAEG